MKMFYSGRKPTHHTANLPKYTAGCVNLTANDDGATVRSGLKVQYTDCLYDSTNTNIRVIDQRSPVWFSGAECKVYVAVEDLGNEHKITATLYSDTKVHKFTIGTFTTDRDKMYRNCLIFNGTPHFGIGLYALVSVVVDGTIIDRVLCELSTDGTEFIHYTDDDYYIPTVLIHGRGNAFFRTEESVRNTLKEPQTLQPYNLLSGVFSATFRTDGTSVRFFLPKSNLEMTEVKVSFNGSDGREYNWIVPEGEYYSNTQEVVYVTYNDEEGTFTTITKNIGILVSRNNGSITTHINNFVAPLPFVDGALDNLKVTAKVKLEDSASLLSGTEFFTVESEKNGGQATVIINENENRMYFSSPTDLFYFPGSNICEFSTDLSDGFGVYYTADKTYLQSGSNIYAVSSGAVNTSDGVTVKSALNINKTGACVSKDGYNSVRAVGGKLYFLSSDGYICSVTGSNLKRENDRLFENTANVWSEDYNGEYILCIGNRAYFANEDIAPFYFESLPENTQSCSQILTLITSDNCNFSVFRFGGDFDSDVSTRESKNVKGEYVLENADFGLSEKKSFYKIRLCFNCKTPPQDSITLTLTDEFGRHSIRDIMLSRTGVCYKDIYFNFRCRNMTVSLKMPNEVQFCGGEISYTI